MIRNSSFIWLLLVTTLMVGCAPQYVVTPMGDFPTPLVKPLPLHIGTYLSPEFSNYIYHNSNEKRSSASWTINLGAAQKALFENAIPPLFQSVTMVTTASADSWPSGLDAVLIPEVVDFEYATPRITKLNVFEVWIKYRFHLLAPDGSNIATWTMPAYGKTPTAFLKSKEEAVHIAAIIALRDGGASFVTGFDKVPEIKTWLDEKLAERRPSENNKPLSAKTVEENDAQL